MPTLEEHHRSAYENHGGVWVFNGAGGRFPSGVFSTRQQAEAWIKAHKLTGMLTLYPLDMEVYEWTIQYGYFTPSRPTEETSDFIGRFSHAILVHYHYEDGEGG